VRFTVIITGQALSWESRFRHEFSPSLLSPIRRTFKNGCRLGEDRMSGLCWLGILIVILCLYTSSLGGTRLLTIKWVCFKQKLVNIPMFTYPGGGGRSPTENQPTTQNKYAHTSTQSRWRYNASKISKATTWKGGCSITAIS